MTDPPSTPNPSVELSSSSQPSTNTSQPLVPQAQPSNQTPDVVPWSGSPDEHQTNTPHPSDVRNDIHYTDSALEPLLSTPQLEHTLPPVFDGVIANQDHHTISIQQDITPTHQQHRIDHHSSVIPSTDRTLYHSVSEESPSVSTHDLLDTGIRHNTMDHYDSVHHSQSLHPNHRMSIEEIIMSRSQSLRGMTGDEVIKTPLHFLDSK